MKKIYKTLLIIFLLIYTTSSFSQDESFKIWLSSFKKNALKKGISENTFDQAMKNVKFLPKVIEYDRYQPEFYEDSYTYISKRSSKKKNR